LDGIKHFSKKRILVRIRTINDEEKMK